MFEILLPKAILMGQNHVNIHLEYVCDSLNQCTNVQRLLYLISYIVTVVSQHNSIRLDILLRLRIIRFSKFERRRAVSGDEALGEREDTAGIYLRRCDYCDYTTAIR